MEENVKAWTEDEIEDIWQRHLNGESNVEIASLFGKTPDSIRGVIRRKKKKENTAIETAAYDDNPSVTEMRGTETEFEDDPKTNENEVEYSAVRTHVRPSFIRPRRKEAGRLYTGR